MKSKKKSVVVTIIIVIACLLVFGLSFLPIGNAGDLDEYFSKEEFSNLLSGLTFQGGTIGLLLGIAMYVGFVFVIVMFIVALCKKRGWFALLDLLALFLGFRAAMSLAYWGMMNRSATGALIFGIGFALLCVLVSILPLLCAPNDVEEHHATAMAPLPSSIPTVEKKETAEETSTEEKPSEEPVVIATEKPEDSSAEEPEKEETPVEEKTEPVEEEKTEENETSAPEEEPAAPIENEEKAAEAIPAEPAKEEPAETPAETAKNAKITKTEEKPMKVEKKTTKAAAAKTPAKAAAPKAAPKAAATPAPKAAAKPAQKAAGKYEVYPEAGFFKYRLKANNGEILIVSNGYKTRDGAHKGIDTLVKAVAGGVAKIVIDKNKYAQFRLYTASDSRLIVAGEYYPNAKGAQSALESVEKFYKTDKIVDLDEIPEDEIREWRIALPKAEKSDKGKFEIYIDETKKYRGRLLANNGQLLFATAAYAAKSGVTGALEKVQKKFSSKDVTVTCDKQGRYQFIVYADNGSVLVMGESYTSKDRAISAAKSSMNFSTNPSVVDVTKDAD